MRDLLIVHVEADHHLVIELNNELNILGVRTKLMCVQDVKNLNSVLSQGMSDHSAKLVFLTSNFSNQLIEANIKIKTTNKKILFMPYEVNQEIIKALEKQMNGVIQNRFKTITSYALNVIKEMATKERNIKLRPSSKLEDIWKSPLYIYQKKEGLKNTKKIILDLTWSANPTRPEPAPALEKTLRQTFEYMKGGPAFNVLDFGAGKLRHTVILLEAGHNVTAVEYPEIFLHPTQTVKNFIARAEKQGKRFGKVTYPDALVSLEMTYDLILLINVVTINPNPLERLFILDQCNKKVKKGKYLLWFTQHGDQDQRNVVSDRITDGGCTIKQARKTFYTEFDKDSVDLMLSLFGFERESLRFDSGSNHAWLYKKDSESLIDIQKIALKHHSIIERTINVGDDNDTIIADMLDADTFISLADVLHLSLVDIKKGGGKDAYKYEKIITQIIKYIFKEFFNVSDIQRQYPLNKGKLKIDIKANWRQNNSLNSIIESYKLTSTFVPIECKNYSADIGNTELAQILTRSHKDHRNFGIVTCRTIIDDEKISDSLYQFYESHKFLVIVLDDSDIKYLLKLQDEYLPKPPWNMAERDADENPIVQYINKRIEEVLHNNKRKNSIDLFNQLKGS